MDAPLSSPSGPQLDSRVISGWAALERGDIEQARAVLQDVYSADPAHPALPLLAAGIRRARPRQIPWRGIVLLIGFLAAGAYVWRSSIRFPTSPAAATATDVAALQQEPAAAGVAPHSDGPIGTAGRDEPARRPAPAFEPAHAAADDEVQIRQAISRFATAYSSRWTHLTFPACDISRSDDTASVTCRSNLSQGAAASTGEGTWLFACRKIGDSWKIVRMQPPADLPPD